MEKIVKIAPSSPRLIDEAKRIIRFRGTSGSVDRDGESIDPKGWNFDNYMKNPVVQFGHNYSERPIARTVKIESSDEYHDFYVQFPASADEAGREWFEFTDSVYRLAKSGFLNATSVGFRPLAPPRVNPKGDGVKEPRRTYVGQELLELSIVPVPSNPEALANAFENGLLKSADVACIKRIITNETKDTKNIKWAEEIDDIISVVEDAQKEEAEVDELLKEIEALKELVGALADKIDTVDTGVKTINNYVSIANLPETQLRVIKNHIDCALDELDSGKTVKAVGDPDATEKDGISVEDVLAAILGTDKGEG